MSYKSLSVTLAALLMCACTGYEFKTNLDPSNFKEYFKPSYAQEVSDEELESLPNRSIGLVEGLSCQIKETDAIATEAQARTDARVKAADLGANAIKFGKCVHLKNTPACIVSVTCYADALVIDEQHKVK
ncbi:MAG: Rcs stress response system protein RcsF [Succinivibrio sp.]